MIYDDDKTKERRRKDSGAVFEGIALVVSNQTFYSDVMNAVKSL